MKGKTTILKLIAATLLMGLFADFGCEIYVAGEQQTVELHDLKNTTVDQLSVPCSNLFTSSRPNEESESHRYIHHQPVSHVIITDPILADNLHRVLSIAYEDGRAYISHTPDILLAHCQLII